MYSMISTLSTWYGLHTLKWTWMEKNWNKSFKGIGRKWYESLLMFLSTVPKSNWRSYGGLFKYKWIVSNVRISWISNNVSRWSRICCKIVRKSLASNLKLNWKNQRKEFSQSKSISRLYREKEDWLYCSK